MSSKSKAKWDEVVALNIKDTFPLGPINAESLLHDPKHLCFTLSRYKFVVKMLAECKQIVEIGCGEGLGAFVFNADTKAKYLGVDFDEAQIEYAKKQVQPRLADRADFIRADLITETLPIKNVDGLLMLDVIEHIHPDEEKKFLTNCFSSLGERAVAVIGTPSLNAHAYASPRSQEGHINLFEPKRLVNTLREYFPHVFFFSMNDEMVHTGYSNMAHYLMALCVR